MRYPGPNAKRISRRSRPRLLLSPKLPLRTRANRTSIRDLSNASGIESSQSSNGSAVKSLVDHVEQIKENLKGIIRDLNNVIDTVKAADKERKSSEKEIEAVRTKLRQIQSVAI